MSRLDVLRRAQRAGAERAEREEAARDEVFRRKVQAQQFLKHHGAILRALIRVSGDIDLDARPGEFERRVLEARALAVKVAAGVLAKPEAEVTMEEARPYRQECSETVAWCWTRGRDLDAEAVAAEIARAVLVADAVYDADTVPWRQVSGEGSLAMTVVPAAMRLRRAVDVYDFRLGRDAVLGRLCEASARAAADAVEAILPAEAGPADRTNLFQSLLREYSTDLRVMYEQGARKTVRALVELPEEDREAYLSDMRPLDAILEAFQGVARRNTELNAAANRAVAETLAPARPDAPRR